MEARWLYGNRSRALHQGIYWFEEPIVYDDYEGNAQIAREIRTPVQIGEILWGAREFHKAVMARTADLYVPDLMRIGGVPGPLRTCQHSRDLRGRYLLTATGILPRPQRGEVATAPGLGLGA